MKAIFFDLDDTLVFSEDVHTQAWQLCLNELGIDHNNVNFQDLIGYSDMKHAHIFKEKFALPHEEENLSDFKKGIFLDLSTKGFESAFGRQHLLAALAGQYTLGVVSSSPHAVIEHVLNVEKIRQYFDFIVGYDDCNKHKPDPEPYLKALTLAKVAPQEALVIEDSVAGITSAINAQIPVIGLRKHQTPNQLVQGVKYYNDFMEIHNQRFAGA